MNSYLERGEPAAGGTSKPRGSRASPRQCRDAPALGPLGDGAGGGGLYPGENARNRFLGKLGPRLLGSESRAWGVQGPAGWVGCCSLMQRPFMDQSRPGRNTAADAPYVLSGLQLKVISSVPLPLPPQLGWEQGEEKEVTAKQMASTYSLSGTALLPKLLCKLEPALLLIFALQEAMKRLKGHQGVRDTVANPRAWPEPALSPSCPPPPPSCSAPHVQWHMWPLFSGHNHK